MNSHKLSDVEGTVDEATETAQHMIKLSDCLLLGSIKFLLS